jgi:hypothetical protein
MTEDEAKTKWCPMFRVSHAGAGGSQYSTTSFEMKDNRNFRSQSECLASACMAWRWNETTYSGRYGDTPTGEAPTEGHCGLAGRP